MKKSDNCCFCQHSSTLVDRFPCNLCCNGNGRHSKNYFQEKKTTLTVADIEEAVERLKKGGNGRGNA